MSPYAGWCPWMDRRLSNFAGLPEERQPRGGADELTQLGEMCQMLEERASSAEAEVAQLQANHDRQVRLKRTLHEHYDRLHGALTAIYRLPCAHPDDPAEDRKLAMQFAEAQRIAGEAIDPLPDVL